ncbi:MAG: spinster family MFS transporter, partial [Candidatus Methylomirabilales bacterium]
MSRGRLLLVLAGVNLLNYIDRQVPFAVFPPLKAELGLSDTQLGLLASAFMWVYLSAAPAFGLLADRWSRPGLVGLGVALWSAATAYSAAARSYAELFLTRAVVGVGEASYGSIAPAMLSDAFPAERRGRALALFSMAIPVGSALGYVLGGAFERALGWRAAFLLVGAPGLLLAWLVARLPDVPRGGGAAPRPGRAAYRALLRTPSYWLNCLGMTAMTFAIGGLAAWVPTYLVRVRGMDLAGANLTFGLLTLVSGIGGTLAGGWLGDLLQRRVASAYFLVSGVGLALSVPFAAAVILLDSRTAVLAGIFLAEVCIFLNTGPLNAIIAAVSPPEVRATAYALNIFIIHALGDAVSPTIVGMVSDRVGLGAAFWIAPGSLALAAAFCFWGMRHYAADA